MTIPPGVEVVLRPTRREDLGFLYTVAARWPESWSRVCRQRLPHPHEFEEVFGFAVLDSRTIEVVVDGDTRLAGAVTLFDVDERPGTVWFENVGLRGDANEAVRDEATSRLVHEVFTARRFRKIYARHQGYDAPPLAALACPVHEEARLVDQVVHDDFAWDEVVSAVYLDEWTAATR
jgi:hypothetical protein